MLGQQQSQATELSPQDDIRGDDANGPGHIDHTNLNHVDRTMSPTPSGPKYSQHNFFIGSLVSATHIEYMDFVQELGWQFQSLIPQYYLGEYKT